jgi:hypothetical protein
MQEPPHAAHVSREFALATAYNTHLNRIANATEREEEGDKGFKRIDYLIPSRRTRFVGIVVTRKPIPSQ